MTKYNIRTICLCLLLLPLLLLTSCGSGFVTRDMIINTSSSSSSVGGSGSGSEDPGIETPEEPAPASVPVAAAFKYILPNGEIDPECPIDLANTLQSLYASSGRHSPDFYTSNAYKITVVESGNLTKSQISSGNTWKLNDAAKGEYTYFKGGEQFIIYAAVETKGVDVTYYQYRSLNPFFSAYGSYNTRSFAKTDGSEETLMKRFQFYRWSGFASGQGVSNYMIAIDTYTGLVFQFAEIDEWATILGIDAPSKYAPFESYSGRRNFYEYDPIGYVDASGNIVTDDWYKEEVAKPFSESKTTTPGFGKSPYYYEEGKTDSIDASVPDQGGYPASGTLTVTAKKLKNIDVGELTTIIPDDTAVVGGSTMYLYNPYYTYEIGYEAYSGVEKPSNVTMLVAQKTDVEISKGSERSFSSSKSYTFSNEKTLMTLDLHSEINRGVKDGDDIRAIGGFNLDWLDWLLKELYTDIILPEANVSSIDVPTSLIYNRELLQWEDGNGFTLKDGETKDYTITYSYGDGSVQLTYTLSWTREVSSSETGNVIIPSVTENALHEDSQLTVSGSANAFQASYTDDTLDSAIEDKNIVLDLYLYNLDATKQPIVVTYTKNSSNLVKSVTLDNSFITKRGGSYGDASIQIAITLGSKPWSVQEETVTVKLVYPSEGYNAEYSPKEITLKIRREHGQED